MDLAEYERTKFDLAEILRSVAVMLHEERPDIHGPFNDLFARLAEDRFNLVVVGRFSRGKSSLMNAMLDTERLPTGIVPLTSVITTVSYGSTERAFIEHEGWRLAEEIRLDALADYVTQQGNPGNRRRVSVARVELSAELLRRGFHFVDTPGLGSSILENTRTTERFFPQADAFMLVTSYDSPLSEEELQVIQHVVTSASQIFLVINKHDTVSLEERTEVLHHVRDQCHRVFGDPLPKIFSVSAREAIRGAGAHDRKQLAESGVIELWEELTRFLLNEKQGAFLLRMCERIAEALRDVPNAREAAERLRSLHGKIATQQPSIPQRALGLDLGEAQEGAAFSSCAICARLDREIYDFLCKYQYDIIVRQDMQEKLAQHGGLCPFHTWQYEVVASPHGTCIGFASLFERLARRLREIAASAASRTYAARIEEERPAADTCDLCRAHLAIEQAAIAEFAGALPHAKRADAKRPSGLCLPHLQAVIEAVASVEVARELLTAESSALERLSEDMRRYALKHDGIRRFLASAEELSAARRALMLLAGHPNVNGPWTRH